MKHKTPDDIEAEREIKRHKKIIKKIKEEKMKRRYDKNGKTNIKD